MTFKGSTYPVVDLEDDTDRMDGSMLDVNSRHDGSISDGALGYLDFSHMGFPANISIGVTHRPAGIGNYYKWTDTGAVLMSSTSISGERLQMFIAPAEKCIIITNGNSEKLTTTRNLVFKGISTAVVGYFSISLDYTEV